MAPAFNESETTTAPRETTAHRPAPRRRARWFQRGRVVLVLYLIMLPTIASMLVFSYYPKLDVVRYAFYRWIPNQVEEWQGLRNFAEALHDVYFLQSFSLVLILLAANLVKMWPSILTAVVLHRLRSERLRYVFQVLFVVPMVIPGLVWILIWKSFYDPNVGMVNRVLNATGLMAALRRMDGAMPALASGLAPVLKGVVAPLFGNVWGLGVFGVTLLLVIGGLRALGRRWFLWIPVLAVGWCLWGSARGAAVLTVCAAAAAARARVPLRGDSALKWIGGGLVALAAALVLLGGVWTEPTYAFDVGSPAWLAHSKLIIPAVIFWGFPWVGVVGVLIYLAGLQQISQDVYEAAEIDGVSTLGKFFRIELPLVMTQVRINLIFMTMHTLTGYGLFLLLLGPEGGPGGRGFVPGLYMYRKAFIDSRYGYACALGLIMFLMILLLTFVYQKVVRVEK